MVWVVHQLHADRLVWNDRVLDRLAATDRLTKMITAGVVLDEVRDPHVWPLRCAEHPS